MHQFNVARGATKTVCVIGGVFIDTALPASGTGTASGMALAYLVTSGIDLAEMITMVPMKIGQSITSTSLVAASGSVDVLSSVFGTHEASFSLAEFVTLVRREWNSPLMADQLPEDKEKYSVLAVARSLVAWATLQRATSDHHVAKWLDAMEPVPNEVWLAPSPEPIHAPAPSTGSRDSRLFVMEDVFLPEHGGQLITADIGEKSLLPPSAEYGREETLPARNFGDIRLTLRRLSKLCLGGQSYFAIPIINHKVSLNFLS
jgi:sn1-specific diacylglycerol lipase